jgi:2-phosphosulfolactate phosphatase
MTHQVHGWIRSEDGKLKINVTSGVPDKTPSGSLVIVDVLRSSSTIIQALRNGAEAIIPFTNIQEAIRFRSSIPGESVVLVGERNGITPRGFDYNISPFDVCKDNVCGKTILYSSSNLTRVLGKVKRRSNTIIGGLVNARAAADFLRAAGNDATIIACGTREGPTIEDVAGAGAIAANLLTEDLSDNALVAVGLYRNPRWRSLVKRGRISKRLRDLGFMRDVSFCLRPDTNFIVPRMRGNRIVALPHKGA